MSFGNILGQVLQDGMGGRTRTRDRVTTSARNLDQAGGGLGGIFDRLQGAGGGTAGGSSTKGGGLAEMARDFIGREQAGGFSGGQIGGIGAAVGAMLGGGLKGAARGGALAVLGTLAVGALRGSGTGADVANRMGLGEAGTASDTGPGGVINVKADDISEAEVSELTSPETERLLLSAMISSANADGRIDAGEMRSILDKLDDSDATAAERDAVMEEIRSPLSLDALASRVQSDVQAAQVYAAAMLSVDGTNETERNFLYDLAEALNLDSGTVTRLQGMTGAPTAA